MVWTGRATQHIRQSMEQASIDLPSLRKAWEPVNTENYVDLLARANLKLHIVLAKRDKVVLPEISHRFIKNLQDAGAQPTVQELNCGHYSLAMPPYIAIAGLGLLRMLNHQ